MAKTMALREFLAEHNRADQRTLKSIPDAKEAQITVWSPDITVIKPSSGLRKGDPYDEYAQIADFPWEEFGYKTLVWDTMTYSTEIILDQAASETKYTSNPITFGSHKDHRVFVPVEGDYRAAQTLGNTLTAFLMEREMDLIICGHVGIESKGKKGTLGFDILRAGFALVGQATVAKYGGIFDQYVRLKRELVGKKGEKREVVLAQISPDPIYGAGVREDIGEGADLSDVEVPKGLEGSRALMLSIMEMSGLRLDQPHTGFLRMCLYSEPKVGKTALACSAPRGPILYVAIDRASEYLRSVYREVKFAASA